MGRTGLLEVVESVEAEADVEEVEEATMAASAILNTYHCKPNTWSEKKSATAP